MLLVHTNPIESQYITIKLLTISAPCLRCDTTLNHRFDTLLFRKFQKWTASLHCVFWNFLRGWCCIFSGFPRRRHFTPPLLLLFPLLLHPLPSLYVQVLFCKLDDEKSTHIDAQKVHTQTSSRTVIAILILPHLPMTFSNFENVAVQFLHLLHGNFDSM